MQLHGLHLADPAGSELECEPIVKLSVISQLSEVTDLSTGGRTNRWHLRKSGAQKKSDQAEKLPPCTLATLASAVRPVKKHLARRVKCRG